MNVDFTNEIDHLSSCDDSKREDTETELKSISCTNYRIHLSWKNVNVFYRESKSFFSKKDIECHQILHNISGDVEPGTLLAIMGSSGSGKSTLLDVLTDRNLLNLDVSGEVLVNGQEVGRGITQLSAYVQQDDLFLGTLTVREHLSFHAQLRMDKGKTKQERLNKIEEVANKLGLSNCLDTVIGVPGSVTGLSGGEKKRLAFASEIITDPMLMYCDEPTSGLDSEMSQNVVSMLKQLTSFGRTILFTIHQPSAELFSSFDHLLLLAEGRVAYQGTGNAALSFFEKAGYRCPTNYNPPDFFMKYLSVIPGEEQACRRRIQVLQDLNNKEITENMHLKDKRILESNITNSGLIVKETSLYKATLMKQFQAVFWRCWIKETRDLVYIRITLTQCIIFAMMFGIMYFHQDTTEEGIINIKSAIFLVISETSNDSSVAGLKTFILDRPTFLREHWNGMYRTEVYFLCKTVSQFPIMLFRTFLFTTISYWMIGLRPELVVFLYTFLIMVLTGTASRSFGYLISTSCSTMKLAATTSMPFVRIFALFGGYLINIGSIPVYVQWMKYLSWVYYGYESILITQFRGVTNITCTDSVCASTGDKILEKLGFYEIHLYRDMCALFCLSLVYYLMALVILLLKNRTRT